MQDTLAHRIQQLNPLALAHVGDSVFDLYVRSALVLEGDKTAHALHKAAVALVNAAAQAQAARRMLPLLTEEEAAIFRRGRNAGGTHVPIHASGEDYHLATGLEAVCGYLYLSHQMERLEALLGQAVLFVHDQPKEALL
nr:ribonuclease III domain-containing protein [bacterium]